MKSEWVEEVVKALVAHHSGLRTRFEYVEEKWRQQRMREAGAGVYRRCDLSGMEEQEQQVALEREVRGVQGSLDVGRGELVRAVEYELGEGRGRRLLLVIHHLVVDGVSWRILLGDLERGYGQLQRGEGMRLGVRTTSYGRWAEKLVEYSGSEGVRAELEYWSGEQRRGVKKVPRDYEGVGEEENTVATQRSVTVWLEEEETRELLQEVPGTYHTQINDVLLTALARVVGEWSGSGEVLVDLEGHGREDLFAGVDVSRTVGWFTNIYPVVLQVQVQMQMQGGVSVKGVGAGAGVGGNGAGEGSNAMGNGRGNGNGAGGDAGALQLWDAGRELKSIKEQLRQIPGRGMGYGVLRYVGEPGVRRKLAAMPRAEVRFNYLGQFDQVLRESELFLPTRGAGEPVAGENRQRYVLDVSGSVAGGRLRMSWSYSEKLHRRETVEQLANRYMECLRQMMEHCRREDAGGYTPSDFPLAKLEQEELERWQRQGEIEDVYSLSPMQQGLLFHALYEPESPAYFNQMACRMRGELEAGAFRGAWEEVVRRQSVLRTSFEWEGREEAVQVVWKQVELGWREEDWRGLGEEEQREKWQGYLKQDQAKRFDFRKAPLLRLGLLRTGEQSYYFVWSNHHILFDGWSRQRLMREVFRVYARLSAGAEAGAAQALGKVKEGSTEGNREGKVLEGRGGPRYRDYIAWLRQQDEKQAERFWREELKGFSAPTRLWIEAERRVELNQESGGRESEISFRLDALRARAAGDGEHGGAGSVGMAAEPLQRRAGCGVWSDGSRASGGDSRNGGDGWIVHQHLAGAGAGGKQRESGELSEGAAGAAGGGAAV